MKQIFEKATFAQLFCLLIANASLLSIVVVVIILILHPAALSNTLTVALVTSLLGALIASLSGCVRFITGSSSGSQAKDDAIANSVPISQINSIPKN